MRQSIILLGFIAGAPAIASAQEQHGLDFFEARIRPVLAEHCYSCHSTRAKKVKGKLWLDSREATRKGGETGPAVVPGKPEASLLLKAVSYSDDSLRMPPKGKLPDNVIADLEAWIKMGAPDPRTRSVNPAAATTWDEMLRTRRDWWSLKPVIEPGVPAIKNITWSRQRIDQHLMASLEKSGLEPADPAPRATLIRRLSLVLTGLPPMPSEITDFERDSDVDAYEKLVDRLLKSPHFGERWARHWLDVVRFSETHGNEWNYEVHHAWRYRDYLIRAFNDDVPFDQLIREHIAGDLLPRPRRNEHDRINESVIGTAFYRFGEVNHDDCIDLRQIGYDLLDNQIDTLTKAFQATTVACARCHDHKIDAVSMKDYYGLLGVLRSSRQVTHTIDAPEVNAGPIRRLRQLKQEIREELGRAWLTESEKVARYLMAASTAGAGQADGKMLNHWQAALRNNKSGAEEPLKVWRQVMMDARAPFATRWRQAAAQFTKDERERAEFNAKRFRTWADFRKEGFAGWQAGGQALRHGPGAAGDFALDCDGDAVVKAIFPAGVFTHAVSEKLNGTLRSPILPRGLKHISFQVMGGKSAAVRLVSNQCQLNYRNFRALTSGDRHWITLSPPEDADGLRVYAELMTKFDNPKYPDQLGTLGGDSTNQRVPWDKAAADPHSFWGVTHVVTHDEDGPPRAELGHLRPLFAEPAPKTVPELADRYAATIANAVRAWHTGKASDHDVHWLAYLLNNGLLPNRDDATPRLRNLVDSYRAIEKGLARPRIVPGLADWGPGIDQPIFVRGDCLRPGERTARRYLEVLSTERERFPADGSGRLALAQRIANAGNPLTARVMVNRVWHHLFGTGLVRTVDDFGRVGELPSHPALLDHLAARFVDERWSIKKLIRAIVLSRSFQMSNRPEARAREIDPQNRWLHHYPARRMEAEAIRDAILAASGRLDRSLYGPSIAPYRDKENADRRLFPGPLDGLGRRSIYIKNILMESPAFLGAFNFPGGKVTQGRRDLTNVPAQALAFLNDPFVLDQAAYWSGRLVQQHHATPVARIESMFAMALGRAPDKQERERFERAVQRFAELGRVAPGEIMSSRQVWANLAHAMFNLKEFIYIP